MKKSHSATSAIVQSCWKRNREAVLNHSDHWAQISHIRYLNFKFHYDPTVGEPIANFKHQNFTLRGSHARAESPAMPTLLTRPFKR